MNGYGMTTLRKNARGRLVGVTEKDIELLARVLVNIAVQLVNVLDCSMR